MITITPFKSRNAVSATVIELPCSKSLILRHAVYASLANGTSMLKQVSRSDDLDDMLGALRAFGVSLDLQGSVLRIEGQGGTFAEGDAEVALSLSGVTARMISALAALRKGKTYIDGLEPLRKRPLGEVLDGVRQLGFTVKGESLPVSVYGGELPAGLQSVTLDGRVSSQFFTAMLAIGPCLKDGLQVLSQGELVSKPYIDLTLKTMALYGVQVENNNYETFNVKPSKYEPVDLTVAADASAASYFMALATLHGIAIKLPGVFDDSSQGDLEFLEICKILGASASYDGDGLIITGPQAGTLKSLGGTIDMESMPDVAPTLFAMAPFIPGGAHITGLQTLRVKECDRIACPQTEFKKLGLEFEAGPDWVRIKEVQPNKLKAGVSCGTYHDHRMAMSLAVLASKLPVGITLEEPECVGKTFPLFWQEFQKLL